MTDTSAANLITNWKDITSYSASDKHRIPQTYEARCSLLRVVITRHIDRPGDWLLRSNLPGLDMIRVATGDDLLIAKRNALKLIENRIAELQQDLEGIGDD